MMSWTEYENRPRKWHVPIDNKGGKDYTGKMNVRDIYIETERPPEVDAKGIPYGRDSHVLVVGEARFFFSTKGDAQVAKAAARWALGR